MKNVGKKALITRALYGGTCAGRDFWHCIWSCIKFLGFNSSRTDPDVWMRESVRTDGFTKYYEYVLLYTENFLVVSGRAETLLRNEIGNYFELKEYSIGPATKYLDNKLREVRLKYGQKCWAFGSKQYIEAAVQNVVDYCKKREKIIDSQSPRPHALWTLVVPPIMFCRVVLGLWIRSGTLQAALVWSSFTLPLQVWR